MPDAAATASPSSRRGDGNSTLAQTPSARPADVPSRPDIRWASQRSMPRVGTATTSCANGSGGGSRSRSRSASTRPSARSDRWTWSTTAHLRSAHGVGPGRDRVIALGADGHGQWAARILPGAQALERVPEVVLRRPAELTARPRVDVDALDAWEHPPAAGGVDGLVAGKQVAHDGRRVDAQRGNVGGRERRRGADDVAAEADRGPAPGREPVRADDVLEVDAAIQQLVDLDVGVVVGGADVVVVVALREEARGPQDQARQAV